MGKERMPGCPFAGLTVCQKEKNKSACVKAVCEQEIPEPREAVPQLAPKYQSRTPGQDQ